MCPLQQVNICFEIYLRWIHWKRAIGSVLMIIVYLRLYLNYIIFTVLFLLFVHLWFHLSCPSLLPSIPFLRKNITFHILLDLFAAADFFFVLLQQCLSTSRWKCVGRLYREKRREHCLTTMTTRATNERMMMLGVELGIYCVIFFNNKKGLIGPVQLLLGDGVIRTDNNRSTFH